MASSPSQPLLDIQQLAISADNCGPLEGVSLSLPEGQILGILGPNGAGKTTLLRCLYGSLSHYRGQISLSGKALASLSSRDRAKQVAAVTQELPSDFSLTVRSVLATGRTPHQHWLKSDKKAAQVIHDITAKLHLAKYLDKPMSALSGGEKKRVMIARALIQEPQLIVLDEPCNHLDIEHQLSLLEQLKRLQLSCVISLHDIELAARYCDQVLVLQQGQQAAYGPPDQILNEALLEQVFSIATHQYTNPWGQWSLCGAPLPPRCQHKENSNAQHPAMLRRTG